jgi:hypothetical protein
MATKSKSKAKEAQAPAKASADDAPEAAETESTARSAVSGPAGTTVEAQEPVVVENDVRSLPGGSGPGFPRDPILPMQATVVTTVTPVQPTDGGDGTRTSPEEKAADNVWQPFASLSDSGPDSVEGGYQKPSDVPGDQTDSDGNDTAVIAAGLADL